MTLSLKRLQWLTLILLALLIYWGGSWEFRPKMDAMTYGALAKHVLETGDWKNLHYSQQAYSTFSQHPPLVMWMAALLFKLTGASDITSKILPHLAGMLSVLGVVIWGILWRSEWFAFISGLVLLTSSRFIKYSMGLMLDPFLTVFLVWGALALVVAYRPHNAEKIKKRCLLALASGACFVGAFLSKGMPALILPAIAVFMVCVSFLVSRAQFRRSLQFLGFFLVAAGLLSLLWLKWGNGAAYLSRYWHESVAGRMGGGNPEGHWAPLKNLFRVYWPWLPFFCWGLVKIARGSFSKLPERIVSAGGVATLFAVGILAGFVLSGHFLEQYTVPFYPFAALVTAETVAPLAERFRVRFIQGLFWFSVLYAVLLACFPIHVHGTEYRSPIRLILNRAVSDCQTSAVQRIQISTGVAEVWYATAIGLWYTPWDVYSASASLPAESTRSELLLAAENEPIHANWKPTSLIQGDLRLFQRSDLRICPQ